MEFRTDPTLVTAPNFILVSYFSVSSIPASLRDDVSHLMLLCLLSLPPPPPPPPSPPGDESTSLHEAGPRTLPR